MNGADRGLLFWWALLAAVVSSLGIGAISRRTRLREDTAIGIVFTGMFALGIVLISSVEGYKTDLTHFLFGDVLGVSNADLWRMAIFGGLILAAVLALYKEFLMLTFDPLLAATLRLPVRLLEVVLLILIALAVVVSLQTVGVALMVAMLVTPAATASLLTRRLPLMMALAAVLASLAGVIGLYISYYAGIASGATIVLVSTAFFALAWLLRIVQKKLATNPKGLKQTFRVWFGIQKKQMTALFDPTSSNRTAAWLEQLQANGYRLTAPRQVVVEIVASSQRILTPLHVYDLARSRSPGLGLVTVYRTMEKLEEALDEVRRE